LSYLSSLLHHHYIIIINLFSLDQTKGNSKLLIEEEKFRKNGKKKYEQLADKMSLLFTKLSTLSTSGSGNGTSPSNQQASNGCIMNLGKNEKIVFSLL
jgi:hypothetical protein